MRWGFGCVRNRFKDQLTSVITPEALCFRKRGELPFKKSDSTISVPKRKLVTFLK
jgi:hypothetical protein